MKVEREDVRQGIAKLARFVEDWPDMHDTLNKVSTSLHTAPERYGRLAPKFAVRVAELLVGRPDLSYDELVARRDEAAAAGKVFLAVDQLDRIKTFLAPFDDASAGPLAEADARVQARARQLVRRAEALLRDIGDARKIDTDIVPVIAQAARVASSLPVHVPGKTAEEDLVKETVVPQSPFGVNLLELPLLAARWFGRALSGRQFALGQLALIVVTAVIGIWSGLALLYVDKAWGSFADFASAVAWGFAATTILTPIVGAVRGLGTRPTDSTPAATTGPA
jgi:hypothetical protein